MEATTTQTEGIRQLDDPVDVEHKDVCISMYIYIRISDTIS